MSPDCCEQFGLVPRPAEIASLSGEWTPALGRLRLCGNAGSLEAVRACWPQLPRSEQPLPPLTLFVGGAGEPPAPLCPMPPASAESYALRLDPQGATLVASDAAGLYYGLHTLRQLAAAQRTVPCVEIRDWPRHPWRGFQIDLGRQMESMATLKRTVDLMAGFKLNQCYLYLENAFAYSTCREACSPDALTPAQARELDAFCRERHMQLIPAPNLLGHFDWLLEHPNWRHLSETREGPAFRRHMTANNVICTSLPETWELLESMIDDLAAAFSAPFLNVGLDETWILASCSLCAPVREQHGEGEIYRRHVQRLHELLAARGKRMQMWDDMLFYWPEIIESLPRDILMIDWYYEPIVDKVPVPYLNWKRVDQTGVLREAGFEVLLAPWDREFPTYTAARTARLYDAAGLYLTQWEMSQQLLGEFIGALAYGADCAWAQLLEPPPAAYPRLAQALFGTREMAAVTLLAANANNVRSPGGEGQGPARFLRYRRDLPECGQAQRWRLAQQAAEACRNLPVFQSGLAAHLLPYYRLRAGRWVNALDSAWLVNEAALSARALLAGRGQAEAGRDLTRYAQQLAAVAERQRQDAAEMARLWEQDRQGIQPVQDVHQRMQEEWEKTAQWAQELAAFAENPAPGRPPFASLRLVVEVMMPEANAQRLLAEVSPDGETWTPVPLGRSALAASTDFYPAPTDYTFTADVPPETRFVRLLSPGVAHLGIRTARLIDLAQERLPRAIVETGGQVAFPEHLLADDTRFCLLNEAEVAKSFHHPQTLERAWVTLEF